METSSVNNFEKLEKAKKQEVPSYLQSVFTTRTDKVNFLNTDNKPEIKAEAAAAKTIKTNFETKNKDYSSSLVELDQLVGAKEQDDYIYDIMFITTSSRYSSSSSRSNSNSGTITSSRGGSSRRYSSRRNTSSSSSSSRRTSSTTSYSSRSRRYSGRRSNQTGGTVSPGDQTTTQHDNFTLRPVSSYNINLHGYALDFIHEYDQEIANRYREDDNFRQEFLFNLERLADNVNVRRVSNVGVTNDTSSLLRASREASIEDRLGIAMSFLTTMADTPQDLERVIENKMSVFLADSVRSGRNQIGGYFSTADHMVLADVDNFSISLHEITVHELTHALDFYDGELDGVLDRFGGDWQQVRAEAINKIRTNPQELDGLSAFYLNYALTNDEEFLAVMSQFYHVDANDLARNLPKVFQTLDNYFRA
jgi:hypothetical protein